MTIEPFCRETHARLMRELGRAPTGEEYSRATGIDHKLIYRCARKLGLQLTNAKALHLVQINASAAAGHALLMLKLGGPPTIRQLATQMGTTYGIAQSAINRLGLAWRRQTRTEGGKQRAQTMAEDKRTLRGVPAERAREEIEQGMDLAIISETQRTKRLREAMQSGDGTRHPDHLLPPGIDMDPAVRIRTACAICGRPMLVAPRMHPWYTRNAEGQPIWLCSEICLRGLTYD